MNWQLICLAPQNAFAAVLKVTI